MRKEIDLLDEYRRSDFEKRLNLYLEHPSLREPFFEIDQAESVKGQTAEVSASHRKSQVRFNLCGAMQKLAFWAR